MRAWSGRSHLLVYAALGAVLLVVGGRAVRAEGSGGAGGEGTEIGSGGGLQVAQGGPDVVVDVSGAVRRPGVYRLPVGARVDDAVRRAGGATPRAAVESINLAARLADGQQVLVPEEGPGGAPAPGSAAGEEAPISLGSATVEQLETIDGIGPVTAADIVGFRDSHGGLTSVDQLDQVPGIGPATMDALRERLQP